MEISKQDFDLSAPVDRLSMLKIAMLTPFLKWKWRNYAAKDRQFIQRLIAQGVQIDVIWDVGASDGVWALMVCEGLKSIHLEMFEPLVPFNVGYYENLRARLVENKQWRLHTVALGNADGKASIFIPPNVTGSTLIESEYVRSNWHSVRIPVRTIDSMIAEDGLLPPDVLKADIQGFEKHMLEGGEKALINVKALLIEAWLSRGYGPATPLLTELEPWLRARGFILAEVNENYRDAGGQMAAVDAFFVKSSIAPQMAIYL